MSVQKFKLTYDEGQTIIKRAPFTQLCNKTLQTCTNLEAIGVWAFLQSQHDNWSLNPHQLRKHFNIGKDKIYNILTYMINTKLLIRHVQISAKGTHIKTTYTVLDGSEFLDTARVSEECAPLTDSPLPDYPDPVNKDIIKERDLKKKERDIKERSLIDSAIDIAHTPEADSFDNFWDVYPVKKNRLRAQRIWEKKNYHKIHAQIIQDVLDRKDSEPQWQDKQYIPHPSTYLGNKLWNDDITQSSPTKSKGKSSSFDAYQAELRQQNKGTTYEHGAISQYGG